MKIGVLATVAVLAACTVREQPPADSAGVVVNPPGSAPDIKADCGLRTADCGLKGTATPVATPYNPDDSGPADTPQWLAMWADRKRRGIDFAGAGQEPGWMIEVDEGKRLYLLANYGEDTVDVVAPVPVADPAVAGRRVYRVTGDRHTLVVTIEPRACSDAMSGKRYSSKVTVTLDGKTNDGCGRKIE